MPCAPLPTMTLCCVGGGGATGDILAPLPAQELNPGTDTPNENYLSRVKCQEHVLKDGGTRSSTGAGVTVQQTVHQSKRPENLRNNDIF